MCAREEYYMHYKQLKTTKPCILSPNPSSVLSISSLLGEYAAGDWFPDTGDWFPVTGG